MGPVWHRREEGRVVRESGRERGSVEHKVPW